MKKLFFATVASLTLLVSVALPSSAMAAPGDSIALYISAPMAQGSAVTGAGSSTEDFNSASTGTCPSSTAVGTLSTTPTSAACYVNTAQTYGGASFTTATPSFGGSGSKFAATPYPANGGKITFTFPSAVKYVGFWWSAGNTGNTVEFLNGATVVASYDSAQLMTLLGSTVPSPFPGAATVTSLGGDSYPKGRYFGNPRGFSSLTPTQQSTVDGTTVFAYLNLYLGGTVAVDAVRFSGDGFEFDNITTSTAPQTPPSTSVFASSVLGKSVQFMANSSGVTGTMPAQTDTSQANLNTVGFTRPGYTFAGWNTQADNGGTAYANLASYSFASDLTLYAQWTVAPTPTPTPSAPAELAKTGGKAWVAGITGSALVVFGGLLLAISRRKKIF